MEETCDNCCYDKMSTQEYCGCCDGDQWRESPDSIMDRAGEDLTKVTKERDWYRRTLEEIDRECSFSENEGLKRIRSMARAVLYPMPEEETNGGT